MWSKIFPVPHTLQEQINKNKVWLIPADSLYMVVLYVVLYTSVKNALLHIQYPSGCFPWCGVRDAVKLKLCVLYILKVSEMATQQAAYKWLFSMWFFIWAIRVYCTVQCRWKPSRQLINVWFSSLMTSYIKFTKFNNLNFMYLWIHIYKVHRTLYVFVNTQSFRDSVADGITAGSL